MDAQWTVPNAAAQILRFSLSVQRCACAVPSGSRQVGVRSRAAATEHCRHDANMPHQNDIDENRLKTIPRKVIDKTKFRGKKEDALCECWRYYSNLRVTRPLGAGKIRLIRKFGSFTKWGLIVNW